MTVRRDIADALTAAGLDPAEVERVIRRALDEDLAFGPDVTHATVPADSLATGTCPRSAGVLAGVPVAAAVFDLVGGPAVDVVLHAADGTPAEPGRAVLSVHGPTRALLTAERTALNLVCHLSGIATLTGRWVDAVAGTGAAIRTPQDHPGLRALEKYAVRCGVGSTTGWRWGTRHSSRTTTWPPRAASPRPSRRCAGRRRIFRWRSVRHARPGQEALAAGVELLLLDNFDLADTVSAVELARRTGVRLEASGGLDLSRAADVAATGVDFLAVGALTHSAPVLDLGFDLR